MKVGNKNKGPVITGSATPTIAGQSGKEQWKLPALLLTMLGLLIYLPTVRHGFVLDDGLVTTINEFVMKGFAGWKDIFTHSYRAGASISTDSEYMYRPLSVMMFAAEWQFFPNQSWIHHLVNILMYALTAGILFKCLLAIVGKEKLDIAFLATLLFVVHPIHTEVVSNIKSRDEIMSLLFGLLTILLSLNAVCSDKKFIFAPAVTFILALLSKEGAIVIIFLVPLILYQTTDKIPLKVILPLIISLIGWYFIRHHYMGRLDYIPDANDNQLVRLNFSHRSATAFQVLLSYLQLLVWPQNLSWDYSINQIPDASWSSFYSLSSLLIHLGLLFFALKIFGKNKIWSLVIFSYLASIALYSNIFLLIGTIKGERLIYLASVWFCLGFAMLIAGFVKYKEGTRQWMSGDRLSAFYGVTLCIAAIMTNKTIDRSKDWKSSYSLFLHDVNTSPKSFRTHQALADESLQFYMKKYANPADSVKYLDQAARHYIESAKILKTFSNQVGLGNVRLFQKNYQAAIESFESARSIIDNTVIRERLATAYYQYGRQEAQLNNNLQHAEQLLDKSYQLDSTQTAVLTDLGMVMGLQRKFDSALFFFHKAYTSNPKDETIVNNLVRTYILLGQQARADSISSVYKQK